MASSRAPRGALRAIQSPAWRPPFSPPLPARKLVRGEGSTRLQVDSTRLPTVIAVRTPMATPGHHRRRSRPAPGSVIGRVRGIGRPRVRPARIASGGVTGSRY